jgi:hypothetical protein
MTLELPIMLIASIILTGVGALIFLFRDTRIGFRAFVYLYFVAMILSVIALTSVVVEFASALLESRLEIALAVVAGAVATVCLAQGLFGFTEGAGAAQEEPRQTFQPGSTTLGVAPLKPVFQTFDVDQQFHVGDIVQLRSGTSVDMRVEEVAVSEGNEWVTCVWGAGDEYHNRFAAEMLKRVNLLGGTPGGSRRK